MCDMSIFSPFDIVSSILDKGAVMIEALIEENELEMPIGLVEGATDHFSISNKIGEGGFGPVYKVSHQKMKWQNNG